MATTPVSVKPITDLPKKLATYIHEIVDAVHKEAALVMGILVALGVTPTPAADSKVTSGILVGYAAIAQLAEKFFAKS
jgi:hypothetical protein